MYVLYVVAKALDFLILVPIKNKALFFALNGQFTYVVSCSRMLLSDVDCSNNVLWYTYLELSVARKKVLYERHMPKVFQNI